MGFKEDVDGFFDFFSKLQAWFWWGFLTIFFLLIDYNVLLEKTDPNEPGIYIFLALASIWLWTTVRWLKKKGYLKSKPKNEYTLPNRPVETQNDGGFKFFPFLMKNIVAPIVVSLTKVSVQN